MAKLTPREPRQPIKRGEAQGSGWTAARRQAQSEAIRRWEPWKHSTGPRTPEGKAASARRGYKGAQRALWRQFSVAARAILRELDYT